MALAAGLIAPVFVAVALFSGGAASHAQAPIDAPPALADAIRAYVTGQGRQFAGDCRTAQTGQFAGQYCYTVTALSAQSADVRIGQALSDQTTLVQFRNMNGTWQAQGGTPTATATATTVPGGTGTPTAPKTGNAGLVTGESSLPMLTALLAVGAGTVAAGWLLVRRTS